MDPEVGDIGGVWATHFRTAITPDGLTIDFIRTDPFDSAAIVVARVACSHRVLAALSASLRDLWHDWAWQSSAEED